MKRLHWFVVKSFLGPFFMTFFICVFILLMQFLWKYIDDLVGKGLEWNIIAELLAYASMGLVPLAFPLAMLLASIMTFGNLGENYELVAMKASGISLFRIMKPLMIVSVVITSLAFYFANNILPTTNLKLSALMWSVKQQKPEMVIKEGAFANDIDNYSIKVERKGRNNNMLYDVMIYDHSDNSGNVNVTLADSGRMEITEDRKFMTLTLYSGHSYTEENPRERGRDKRYAFRREHFGKEIINIGLKDFDFTRTDDNLFRNSYRMMNMTQLKSQEDSLFKDYRYRLWRLMTSMNYLSPIDRKVSLTAIPIDSLKREFKANPDTIVNVDSMIVSMDDLAKQEMYTRAIADARNNTQTLSQKKGELYGRKKLINKYAMERHRKFTLSIACLIFFFIGAPLGAIIRKGGLGMPVVVSILMFITYYIVSITGEKFAREDAWSMVGGMWFSTVVFLPLGIFLTYKAAVDSGIMNIESYQLFFKKFFRFFNFSKKKTENQPDADTSANE